MHLDNFGPEKEERPGIKGSQPMNMRCPWKLGAWQQRRHHTSQD